MMGLWTRTFDPMGNTVSQLERQLAELQSRPELSAEGSAQLIDTLVVLSSALTNSDVPRAIATAEEARTLSRRMYHPHAAATSLMRLSWLHLQSGAFESGVLEAREALFFGEQLQDYSLMAGATYVLASAQQLAGNYAKAENYWLELLNMAREHSDYAREADFLLCLGILHQEQNDFQRTLEYKLQAHSIYVSIGDSNHIAAKNNVAFAMTKLDQDESAVAWAMRALDGCETSWNGWRAMILHTLGTAYMNLRRYDQANACLREGLALSTESSGRKYTSAQILLDVSKLELVNNNVPAAFAALDRAAGLAREAHILYLEAEANHALFRLYSLMHVHDQANDYHAEYLRCRHQIGCKRMERQVSVIRVDAEVAHREHAWQSTWAQESQRNAS